MNNLKSVVAAVVVSLLVNVGAYFFLQGEQGGTPIPQENLSATPGNSIEGKYFTVGGVEMAYVSMPAISATSSVPCVTRNPWPTASSTLVSFTAGFSDTPIDTTPGIDLSTSSNPYLSSTSSAPLVANYAKMASNGAAGFSWNNGYTTGYEHGVLQLGEYVGLKVGTGTPGNDGFTGKCTAVFRKL